MNLKKIIEPWERFHKQNTGKNISTIALIGSLNSGKSTLCELLNAYVFVEKKNPKLTFETEKVKSYNLPGVISTNLLKVFTTSPVLYELNEKENILDLPAYITHPFNQTAKKQWNPIDSKISFSYFTQNIKACSFILMVEEKFTRQTMEGLKSMLFTFIDFFQEHPKELLDSTAIIITRCPTSSKQGSFDTKIENCTKKYTGKNGDALKEWIKSLKERKAIYIFYKFTSQEKTKEQINNLYEKIKQVPKYQNDIQKVQSVENYNKEIQEQIQTYLEGIDKMASKIVDILKEAFQDNLTYAEFQKRKKEEIEDEIIKVNNDEKTEQTKEEEQAKQEEDNKKTISVYGILLICKTMQNLDQENKIKTVKAIIDELVDKRILEKNQPILEYFEQRINFLVNFGEKLNFDLDNTISTFDGLCQIKDEQNLDELLVNNFSQQKLTGKEYAEIIEAIDYMFSENLEEYKDLAKIWIKAKLQVAEMAEKISESLKSLLQLESFLSKSGNFEMMGQLLDKIAEILVKKNKLGLAVNIFGISGNQNKALKKFEPVLAQCNGKKPLDDYLPYLDFLQQIGCVEESYKVCYHLGQFYKKKEERKDLGQYLKKAPCPPSEKMFKSFVNMQVTGIGQQLSKKIQLAIKDIQKSENE